jgi:uncharacterized protein YuzE
LRSDCGCRYNSLPDSEAFLKPLRWTVHALRNLSDREIPRTEAERAIADPEAASPASSKRQFFMRRYFDDRFPQKMLVRVLVEETSEERVVITVYITSKIGKYYERGSAMKVTYDAETDTMTITLREERIKESDEVRPGVIADFGYDGRIVRFEILDASKIVENAREMQFAVGE